MEALINACRTADYPAHPSIVIADNPGAGGLAKAAQAGIPTAIVDRAAYDSRASFEQALQQTLKAHPVDLVCLAGFMRLLSPDFVTAWPDRIVNIHPSLLPAYKGLNTHERALADGVAETGCTVHFVRPAMDAGPIIIQRKVPIRPGDTPDSLAGRVLAEEHAAYAEAVRLIGEGRIALVNEQVEIRPEIESSKGRLSS